MHKILSSCSLYKRTGHFKPESAFAVIRLLFQHSPVQTYIVLQMSHRLLPCHANCAGIQQELKVTRLFPRTPKLRPMCCPSRTLVQVSLQIPGGKTRKMIIGFERQDHLVT